MLHSLYVQCLKIHLMKLISMKKQHESFHFNAVSEEPFHCRTNWLLHPTETPHILIQIKRLVHIMTQMILEKNQVFVCHALFKDFVYLILNVNNHSKKNSRPSVWSCPCSIFHPVSERQMNLTRKCPDKFWTRLIFFSQVHVITSQHFLD